MQRQQKNVEMEAFGVSVKTFSAHVVVVLRLIVSEKRFSTHERVKGNREIGEKPR